MTLTPAIAITAEQRRTVLALLNRHLPHTAVWACGSRVKGTSRPTSDLDLVVFARSEQSAQVAELREAFEENDLPFRVDLFVWDDVPESFREMVERDCIEVASGYSSGRWQKTTLGESAFLVRRSVHPDSCGETCYVGLEHIGEGSLSLVGHGKASDVESVKSRFLCGDVLFGKLRPYFRKVVRARFDGICSTDIWVVRPSRGVYAGYLFYVMASQKFIDFATQGTQGTRMPRAQWEHTSRFQLRVPPFPVQREIAKVLGSLDDKIELNRRMNETLEAMARALFNSWFVDFDPVRAKMEGRDTGLPMPIADLFPDRLVESGLGLIPEGWEIHPLPQLVEINPRRSLRKGEVAPYLDMANMPTKGHVPHAVVDRQFGSGMRFINGDTLVARITPCLENGKMAYVDFLQHDEIGWGSTEYIVIRPMPPLPNEFAYYLARSTRFREFAIQNMTGTSGRQRVPAAALSQFLLPAPPKPIAESFGKFVRPLAKRASEAEAESRILANLRDTLLPKLISGETRLRDAERQVETIS